MIKIGFKAFGCLSVVCFSLMIGIYLAAKTMPPVFSVRREVRDYIYPTAREHLKNKFYYFQDDIRHGKNIRKFDVSELELNAYLYYLFNERLTVDGEPFVQNPYLFVSPGRFTFRADIPVENAMALFSNLLDKKTLDENVKTLAKAQHSQFTLALTFVISFYWVKDHPYFYLERVYAGVMPIPVSVFLSDYQDQFNKTIWDFYEKNFSFFPAYITKIEVREKIIRFAVEAKVTEVVSMMRMMDKWRETNPDLVSALEAKNCLYGCTRKEWDALHKFNENLYNTRADQINVSQIIIGQAITTAMDKRAKEKREKDIREYMRGPGRLPDRVIRPDNMQ